MLVKIEFLWWLENYARLDIAVVDVVKDRIEDFEVVGNFFENSDSLELM